MRISAQHTSRKGYLLKTQKENAEEMNTYNLILFYLYFFGMSSSYFQSQNL